jgi:hypothetical protein
MTKSSLGDAVASDTEAARRGQVPNINVDIHGGGNRAPAAARFGVGANNRADIERATDAQQRQSQTGGVYGKR